MEVQKEQQKRDEKNGIVGVGSTASPGGETAASATNCSASTPIEGVQKDDTRGGIRQIWTRASAQRHRLLNFLKKSPASEVVIPDAVETAAAAVVFSPAPSPINEALETGTLPSPTETGTSNTSPSPSLEEFDYSPLSLLWSFVPFQHVWRSAWLLLFRLVQREYDLRPYGMGVIVDFGWAGQRT